MFKIALILSIVSNTILLINFFSLRKLCKQYREVIDMQLKLIEMMKNNYTEMHLKILDILEEFMQIRKQEDK